MTTDITTTIAEHLLLDCEQVRIVDTPPGGARVYVPAYIAQERLQIEFLNAVDGLPMTLICVGHDDSGVYVGYKVAS